MNEIVVGVDGSESSCAALEWAIAEAKLRGSSVTAVTAWQTPEAVYMGAMIPDSLTPGLEEAAEQTQATVLERVDAAGVSIATRVVEGDAAQALVDASVGAEMLVVGSRGFGAFRELLLGSVSQRCAHHAQCPVVIVRAGPAPGHSD